jgi:hypothetical protein
MNREVDHKWDFRQIILKELEYTGIDMTISEWLVHESVIDEIVLSIRPEIHEGRIHPYGVLFTESLEDLERYEMSPIPPEGLQRARKMVDGKEWYLLYDRERFHGMVRFPVTQSLEMQMLRRFPARGGLMINRNENGQCRFYQGDAMIIHDRRNWIRKTDVKNTVTTVASCVPGLDKKTFQLLLEFANYLVSPVDGAGGILIWNYQSQHGDESNSGLGNRFSLLNESHLNPILNLVVNSDGAIRISRNGELIESEIHIRYSSKSARVIQDFKGTRHTSSIRHSYDHSEVIVITISEDGPVSVFINGANITALNLESLHQMTRKARFAHPKEKEKISSIEIRHHCLNCERNSIIEGVKFEGKNNVFSIKCPTCGIAIAPLSAFRLQIKPFAGSSNSSDRQKEV